MMNRRKFLATACGGAVGLGVAGCFGSSLAPDTGDAVETDVATEEPDQSLKGPKKKPVAALSKLPRHMRHRREARDRELDGWPYEAHAHPTEDDCERECFSHLFAHEHHTTKKGV